MNIFCVYRNIKINFSINLHTEDYSMYKTYDDLPEGEIKKRIAQYRYDYFFHYLLMERQLKRGVDYIDMKDVYQLILYIGNPIENFHHYQHSLKRGDFDYGVLLEHQKTHAVLLQLQLMEEDLNMEVSLTAINQLAYLFMNGKSHENSEAVEDVKEAMDIHNKYMNTDEVMKGYELERERLVIQTKMNKARREGEKKERYNNVLELIHEFYSVDAADWLKQCSEEQLQKAFHLIAVKLSYEEFKDAVMK